jgi:hypothetical protein
MQAENETLLQGMMDQAYAKWQGKGWSYVEFLDELDALERKVVVMGNLNAQVCNGGFAQWADNGYGIEWQRAVRILMEIGQPACLEVAALVEKVGPQLTYNRRGNLEYPRNRYGDFDEDYSLDFDAQDDAFYADDLSDRIWTRSPPGCGYSSRQ